MFNKHKGNIVVREEIIEIVTACPSTTDQICDAVLVKHGIFIEAGENELGLMQEDQTIAYVENPIPNGPCLWMIFTKAKKGGFMTLDFDPQGSPDVPLICRNKLEEWRQDRAEQKTKHLAQHKEFLGGLDKAELDYAMKKKLRGPKRR